MKDENAGLKEFLVKATLDSEFLSLVLTAPDRAVEGFNLTESQKDTITEGEFDRLILENPDVATVFIRAINMNTLSNDMVAVMPFDLAFEESSEVSRVAALVKQARPTEKQHRLQELVTEINRHNRQTAVPVPEDVPKRTTDHDIFMVGLGLVNGNQVTKEVEEVLKRAKIIYYVGSGLGLQEYLSSFEASSVDLGDLCYVENENRMDAYERMASTVVAAAHEQKPVALALYGHPTVFSYPPFLIKQMCDVLDLSVDVLPGISAFDCLLTHLMIDPGQSGMLMYEATDLLARKRTLLPDVGTILWQLGSVETALYSNRKSEPRRFWKVRQYLLQYYPHEHVVTAIFCPIHPLSRPVIYKFPVGRIADYAEVLHAGFTLYLPPVRGTKTPDLDYELLMRVESEEHLKQITRDE